jgi:hypothetical protein
MRNPTELNKDDVQILFGVLQVEIVARNKTTPPLALASSVNVLARVARLLVIPILSVVPEGGRTPELLLSSCGPTRTWMKGPWKP